VPVLPEPADVVDQHVQAGIRVEDLSGQAPYLSLAGQVGGERVDGGVARRRADVGRGGFGPREVAAGDADLGTQVGEPGCGGLADAAGAASDQDGLAGHRKGGVSHCWFLVQREGGGRAGRRAAAPCATVSGRS
jgi:hypothetical protein